MASYHLKEIDAVIISIGFFRMNVARKRLAAYLWPRAKHSIALNNLRTRIHRINSLLPLPIFAKDELIVLEKNIACFDSVNFRKEIEHRLFGEGNLEIFNYETEGLADELIHVMDQASKKYSNQVNGVAADLLSKLFNEQKFDLAISVCRTLVVFDKNSEFFRRQLMLAYHLSGNRASAIATYEDFRFHLKNDLGLSPDSTTNQLHRSIILNNLNNDETYPTKEFHKNKIKQPTQESISLIERDEFISTALQAIRTKKHVVIYGDPGQGKSSLLRAILDRSNNGSIIQTYPEDSATPFCLIKKIKSRLELFFESKSNSVDPEQEPPKVESDEKSSAPYNQLDAEETISHYVHWFSQFSLIRGALILIDDFHFADHYSARCIVKILRDQNGNSTVAAFSRLQFLITTRDASNDRQLWVIIKSIQDFKTTEHIILENLSHRGTAKLLSQLGYPPDEISREGDNICRLTFGNPLLIISSLAGRESLQSINHKSNEFNFELNVLTRLERCGPQSVFLAFLASISGKHFSYDLVNVVLGLDNLIMFKAWNELKAEGVFSEAGISHHMYVTAIEKAIPSPLKKKFHAKTAKYLINRNNRLEEIVWHALRSDDSKLALDYTKRYAQELSMKGLDYHAMGLIIDALTINNGENLTDNCWIIAYFFPLNSLSRIIDPRVVRLVKIIRKSLKSTNGGDLNHKLLSFFFDGWWCAEIEGQTELGLEKLERGLDITDANRSQGIFLVYYFCAAYCSALGLNIKANYYKKKFHAEMELQDVSQPVFGKMLEELEVCGLKRTETIINYRRKIKILRTRNGAYSERHRFLLGKTLADIGSHRSAIRIFQRLLNESQYSDSITNISTDIIYYLMNCYLATGLFHEAQLLVPKISYAGARRAALFESLFCLYTGQCQTAKIILQKCEWPTDEAGDKLLAFARQINFLQASRIENEYFDGSEMRSIATSLDGLRKPDKEWPQRLESFIPLWLAELDPPISRHVPHVSNLLARLYSSQRWPYFLHASLLAAEEAISADDKEKCRDLLKISVPLLRRGRFPPFIIAPHFLHRYQKLMAKSGWEGIDSDFLMLKRWNDRASHFFKTPESLRIYNCAIDGYCAEY